MTTKIDIASLSLTLCRANSISSFDEGSNESEIIGLFYETFIKDIFGRYPWEFATKTRRLNLTSTDNDGLYNNEFTMPNEAIKFIGLQSKDGLIIDDYEISDCCVLCNEDEVYAKYTYYVGEDSWSGHFVQYAIYALAAMIALPLTDDESLAQLLTVVAYGNPSDHERGGKFKVAANAESQQSPNKEINANSLISARFS